MEETLRSTNTYTKQQWIAEQARVHPDRVFTSLHHLIDGEWMREAYRRTRKDGATGIDGVTADDYEKDLEANLEGLLSRIKSGSYRAPPVRRHYIPKADGTKRPLGIPTFEDKVAQRAILMLLEPIYEGDFLPCSYGFRPGRSAHDALYALRTGIMERGQRWVIDADVSNYFGSISHTHLRSILDLRIKDGVIRRMIDKWLKAGVLEDGALRRSETGTPQGGVISPMLSNIFLHHVLDAWFEREAKPRLRGSCRLVRFADDFVMAFEDARSGSTFWVNVSVATGLRSMRPRRAMWTSGRSARVRTIGTRRSTFSASPTCGDGRGEAATSFARSPPRVASPVRSRRCTSGARLIGIDRSTSSNSTSRGSSGATAATTV